MIWDLTEELLGPKKHLNSNKISNGRFMQSIISDVFSDQKKGNLCLEKALELRELYKSSNNDL